MKRDDWLARLIETLERWQRRPFVYGESDCVRFAAECIEAQTGKRYETPYRTRREALRLIRNAGGLSPLVVSRLGPPHYGRPRRGDVCLVQADDGEGLGVAMGATVAMPAERGLGFHPITAVLQHWRI
jgi:hypothetical protein